MTCMSETAVHVLLLMAVVGVAVFLGFLIHVLSERRGP